MDNCAEETERQFWYLVKNNMLEEARPLARKIFLFVIERYNSFKFNKIQCLKDIKHKFPSEIAVIPDEEIIEKFSLLFESAKKSGELLRVGEVCLARSILSEPCQQKRVEKFVYWCYSQPGSERLWSDHGSVFDWSLTPAEKEQATRGEFLNGR